MPTQAKHRLDEADCEILRCSFDDGYTTQRVFSCITCTTRLGRSFGVCEPCLEVCHIECADKREHGVDMIDIGTKRDFRCDCGTTRAGGNECVLKTPTLFRGSLSCTTRDRVGDERRRVAALRTTERNERNVYGQNFQGLFCSCKAKWDDASATEAMHQCALCCEWYHRSCLGGDVGFIGALPHALIW